MKSNLIRLIVFLSLCTAVSAQTDTTFVVQTQDTGTLQPQRFINGYEHVFGTRQPTRWMLKWNAGALLFDDSASPALQLGGEIKLTPGFSLSGGYEMGTQVVVRRAFNNPDEVVELHTAHNLTIEPRWYFNMPRHIRQGRSANNLSGDYFALRLSSVEGWVRDPDDFFEEELRSFNGAVASLRYGVQRRWFRRGYFDFNYGLGAAKSPQGWRLYASSQIAVGLALARPRSQSAQNTASALCDVFQCFQEDRRMLKIDLLELFNIHEYWYSRRQIGLNTAYEQKIGTSPFSINVQGILSFSHRPSDQPIRRNEQEYTLVFSPRYYYGLKKRIAEGRSGNNLSGAYITWTTLGTYEREQLKTVLGSVITASAATRLYGSGLAWGVQHRLFRHGLIDVALGGMYRVTQTKASTPKLNEPAVFENETKRGLAPLANILIGFAI